MLLSIGADEAAAVQFEDLASALDAGLPLASLGADPAAGDDALATALRQRRVKLSDHERLVLQHGWQAGRASQALRGRALERRRRAEFARTVWSGLRYPLMLVLMMLMGGAITALTMGPELLIGVLSILGVVVALFLVLRHGIRGNAGWVQRLPWIGPLTDNLGELPYLETLHALYGAGVDLRQANATAVGAVDTSSVRRRLRIADGLLQQGLPLAQGLAQALALQPETRALLTTGEQAGQLEDALARALQRRRDVTGRQLADLARRLGSIAYAMVAIGVAWYAISFYSGLFSKFSR
ncbi:MAG: type II secretion system F family protein [Planctomycetes bacterium]|jgi:type II secretory pathway component PulF|nr:type II secretion system F family protein [Planctomycetota bacterium]